MGKNLIQQARGKGGPTYRCPSFNFVGQPKNPPISDNTITGTIKEREPIVDVFEEEDCLRVMVELPGVEENEINLKAEENTLTISTDTSARTYYKKVELPTSVKKEVFESSYRNGILEVKLRKMKKNSQIK